MSRKIRFSGFAEGIEVTLSATKDGVTRGPTTISAWKTAFGDSLTPTGDCSASISFSRSLTEAAPEMIHFELTLADFDTSAGATDADYNPQAHELICLWDFKDSNAASHSEVRQLPWYDASKQRGFKAAHTYSEPGTYNPEVWVIEPSSGKIAYATTSVTVKDPDTVFSGASTIYVSAVDTSAAPAGAITRSTLADAFTYIDGKTGSFRIMLRDGETHSAGRIPIGTGVPTYRLVAEGTGTRPEVEWDNSNTSGETSYGMFDHVDTAGDAYDSGMEECYVGIDFIGPWDAELETLSVGTYCPNLVWRSQSHYLLMHDCYSTGWLRTTVEQDGINDGGGNDRMMGFSKTHITNWMDFGIYPAAFAKIGIEGTVIAQAPKALAGGTKAAGTLHNRHGPIRINGDKRFTCVIAGSDIFAGSNSWDQFGSLSYSAGQPALRWNQLQTAGSELYLQDTVLEGGWRPVALTRRDNGVTSQVQNVVVEGNYVIGNCQTQSLISANTSGITIRNNIGVFAGGTSPHPNHDPKFCITFGAVNDNPDADAQPVKVFNNTFINQSDAGDMSPIGSNSPSISLSSYDAGYTDVAEANNILHQPNLASPVEPYAPLSETVIVTPRSEGYYEIRERHTVTLGSDVGDGETFSFATDLASDQYVTDSDLESVRIGTSGQAATVTFSGGNAIVQNDTGGTWSSGEEMIVILERVHTLANVILFPDSAPDGTPGWEARPTTGSSAIGAATGTTAYKDIEGTTRPASPSVGAWEPSA